MQHSKGIQNKIFFYYTLSQVTYLCGLCPGQGSSVHYANDSNVQTGIPHSHFSALPPGKVNAGGLGRRGVHVKSMQVESRAALVQGI